MSRAILQESPQGRPARSVGFAERGGIGDVRDPAVASR
jgi:hypothetical protein